MKRMSFCSLVILGLIALAPPARSQEVGDLVERIVQPLIDGKKNVGISVGVIIDGERHTYGLGRISMGDPQAPDADTVYEIGSNTKVFTALAAVILSEEGKLKLDRPIAEQSGGVIPMPSEGGDKITPIHVATHTSGMKRLPTNLRPADMKNPYAEYTVERMYEFLRGDRLTREPGSRYEYSNLGGGLLGHFLEVQSNQSYEQLLQDRIFEPLGMNDTCIELTPELRSRLAPGHSTYGRPTPNWDFDALAGAGAIRSTVNDMLTFLSANFDSEGGELSSAMRKTHDVRHKISDSMSIALGWHVQRERASLEPILWHNGGTGGYRTFMGFIKKHRLGVVVLSNTSSTVDPAGFELLRRLENR